jgi:hypothetical protein
LKLHFSCWEWSGVGSEWKRRAGSEAHETCGLVIEISLVQILQCHVRKKNWRFGLQRVFFQNVAFGLFIKLGGKKIISIFAGMKFSGAEGPAH